MGNKFMSFMEDRMMPVAAKIAAERHIRALRDGLAITMPLIIAGSIFMILANLPVKGYAELINGLFGENFSTLLTYPLRATMDILSLIAVSTISYYLAKDKGLDGLSAGAIALSSFILLIPINTIDGVRNLPTTNFGAGGLIVAIFTSFIATEIFIQIVSRGLVIKMPDSVPPAVAKSFTAIVPGVLSIALFLLIRVGFEATSFKTAFSFVSIVLGVPLKSLGLSFGGTLTIVTLYHLFWTLGIHGTRVVFGVCDSFLIPAMGENLLATEAGVIGSNLPNIVTKQWHDIFINGMGGCGATIGLIIIMLLFTKSKQMKTLGKLAIAPAIFNISEPIIFGLPIVMNPIMMIPFVLAPLANAITTYLSMAIGLVGRPLGVAIPWTTPVVIGGILATGDWKAGVLQVFNIFLTALIYFPFVKVFDNQLYREENEIVLDTVDVGNQKVKVGVSR